MHSIVKNGNDTTSGLTSAYQLTQVTSAGLAVVEDTAGYVNVGVISLLPQKTDRPRKVVDQLEVSKALFQLSVTQPVVIEPDPAEAAFSGPLGIPRTHGQRAQLLQQHYQAIPDEIYFDVPEDCL